MYIFKTIVQICFVLSYIVLIYLTAPWWLFGILLLLAISYTQNPFFALSGLMIDIATIGINGLPLIGLAYVIFYIVVVLIKHTVYVNSEFNYDTYQL